MAHVKSAFRGRLLDLTIAQIRATRSLAVNLRKTRKYQTVKSSILEVGVIEPLAVYEVGDGNYLLLDGHLRLEVLKEIGRTSALCLIATDDESFTYNRQVNRLSSIQEHKMIKAAIERGVPAERIAAALNVDVGRIRIRERLLVGIAPEVVELMRERMVGQGVFSILRKMKPIRQIEATEMMISANRISASFAKMVLLTSKQEMLIDPHAKSRPSGVTLEDLTRMEREMEKLASAYKVVEETHGETMLVLVVAKGYITRLVKNAQILDYLKRNHSEIVDGLIAAMDAISADARAIQRD